MKQPAATSANPAREALRAALLDYAQSPGKYQAAFRHPRLLFESLRDVLQIAAGREADEALREAACFFTRTALLRPGADHYTLMGLDRKASGAEVKDRYRLMMRLLHPDFSGLDSAAWPSDAAVRVNGAYEILASPVQRREYDERLGQVTSPTVTTLASSMRPGRSPIDASRRSGLTKIVGGFGLAGVALLIAGLFATGPSDTVHLVQRRSGEAPPVQVVQLEPPMPVPAPVPVVPPSLLSVPVIPAPAPPPPEKSRATVRLPEPVVVARAAPTTALSKPVLVSTAPVEQPPQLAEAPNLPPTVKPDAASPPTSFTATPPAQPAPLLAATPVPVQTVATAPPPAVVPPSFRSGPSLMEAQPLFSRLLQLMESGRGERILNLLDADARTMPSAVALSRQYDSVVDGARQVRVSHVEFKAEPGDGRLFVVGYFRVLAGEQTIGSLGKKMMLRAEFVLRDGTVVITGLSGGAVN